MFALCNKLKHKIIGFLDNIKSQKPVSFLFIAGILGEGTLKVHDHGTIMVQYIGLDLKITSKW